MPHDSVGTLVFCCGRSQQNWNGVTPNQQRRQMQVG